MPKSRRRDWRSRLKNGLKQERAVFNEGQETKADPSNKKEKIKNLKAELEKTVAGTKNQQEEPSAQPALADEMGFYLKPIDPAKVIPVDSRLIQPNKNPNFLQKRAAIINWVNDRILAESSKPPTTKRAIRTGYRVRRNGVEVKAYQFDAKNEINKVYAAFGRQLASKNSPHPLYLELFKLMMKDFFEWFKSELSKIDLKDLTFRDPIQWVESHTEWTDEKKTKYLHMIFLQTFQPLLKNFTGAFDIFTKNGEEFLEELQKLGYYYLENVDPRPRAISGPSKEFCGLATFVQAVLVFPLIKMILPGFVHGVSCHDFADKLRRDLEHFMLETLKAISFDGSGFDSNQHKELQEIVDAGMFDVLEPKIREFLEKYYLPEVEKDVDAIIKGLRATWTSFTASWFLTLKGISEYYNNKTDNKRYRKFFERPTDDALEFVLDGSTFSGHPTETTLGNTDRSLSYMWFVLWLLGVDAPWAKNEYAHCMAAGDDSVMFVKSDLVPSVVAKLKELFAPNKTTPNVGLGQCIDKHTIYVKECFDFDFCSKWCFYDGKDWVITRDYSKLLWNKQVYYGEHEIFYKRPELHAAAIHQAILAEGLKGSLLEDLLSYRVVKNLPPGQQISSAQAETASKLWRTENSWSVHYERPKLSKSILDMIDNRLNLTEASVLCVYQTDFIDL